MVVLFYKILFFLYIVDRLEKNAVYIEAFEYIPIN